MTSMRTKRYDLIIGIFVLVGLTTMAFLIIKLGGVQRGWKYYKLTVFFNKVSGLIEDAPVYYAGVECGSVEKIIPVSQKFPKVKVVLRIKQGTNVREQDIITISSVGILGDKIVKIIPGDTSASTWPAGSTIEGKDPLEITDVVTPALQADVQEIVRGLADLVNEQNRELLAKTIRNFYIASEEIVDDIDSIKQILNEDTLESIRKIVSNIETASRALPVLTDQLTSFINDNTGNVEELIISLTKSSDDISGFINSLNILIREISRGESTLGKLIQTSELYDNINAVIQGIRFYGLLGFQNILHQEELEEREQEKVWEK